MTFQHLKIHWITRPAICFLGVIAGIGIPDLWTLVAALLAAWFVDAQPWDPFAEGQVRERKSNDAPD